MLERIPYVDLKELPKYIEDYYDEGGDTDLLFATGALVQTIIDANGENNKYRLSTLGEKLLRWGFGANVNIGRSKGVEVMLPTVSDEDIHKMFNDVVREAEGKKE